MENDEKVRKIMKNQRNILENEENMRKNEGKPMKNQGKVMENKEKVRKPCPRPKKNKIPKTRKQKFPKKFRTLSTLCTRVKTVATRRIQPGPRIASLRFVQASLLPEMSEMPETQNWHQMMEMMEKVLILLEKPPILAAPYFQKTTINVYLENAKENV